jgi:hypothetical protein
LDAPDIRVLSVTAGKVGQTASLADMLNSIDRSVYDVLAAVNGTFFHAYNTGAKPIVGTIVKNGVMMHRYDGTLIGFGADGSARMGYIGMAAVGRVDGIRQGNREFWVHNWNQILPGGRNFREALINPEYGTETGAHDMTAIVVRNGKVTGINRGNTRIPADGYVYLMPQNSPYNDGRIYVGAEMVLETTFHNLRNNRANVTGEWESMYNITGCGPSLILNGQITANPASENWTRPDLTRGSALRSFIGLSDDGRSLVMGTVPSCTIRQLAEVAQAFNLHNAMNLDGGASSALWLNGHVLSPPGRSLSNIIAVVRVKDMGRYDTGTRINGTAEPGGQSAPAAPVEPIDTADRWARDGITQAIAKGFVPDDIQGNYKNVITREEFCRMAVRWLQAITGKQLDSILAERGLSRSPNPFTDTTNSDILAAYALGITGGTSPTAFSPGGRLTREQAAVMVRNTFRAAGRDVSFVAPAGLADIDRASSWAVDSINFVRNAGVMTGTGGGNFSPSRPYTRQESIVVFNNMR